MLVVEADLRTARSIRQVIALEVRSLSIPKPAAIAY